MQYKRFLLAISLVLNGYFLFVFVGKNGGIASPNFKLVASVEREFEDEGSVYGAAPHQQNDTKFKSDKILWLSECNCSRHINTNKINEQGKSGTPTDESTCSLYSTARGLGQKVFSYAYYRPRFVQKLGDFHLHIDKFLYQMDEKLEFIKHNYPGWVVRLYHNVSTEDVTELDFICKMYCKYDFFDTCNVSNHPIKAIREHPIGRMWRFSVMGDPTVGIFFSRDSDSSILLRELSAVKEWFTSNKTFHMMHDHPVHGLGMLAGLWGARNSPKLRIWRDEMFSIPFDYKKTFDQRMLDKFVLPRIKDDVLHHESYNCKKSKIKATPYPTQREKNYYVGWGKYKIGPARKVRKTICPVECRPKGHKDWKFC